MRFVSRIGNYGASRLNLYSRRAATAKQTTNKQSSAASILSKNKATNPLTSVAASFDKITSATKNTAVHTTKLLSKDKGNIFEGKSQVDKAISDEIKAFASDYNALLSAMENIGSKTYKGYVGDLKEQLASVKDALVDIGITYNASGALEVDTKKLESADIDKVKALFHDKGGLTAKVADKASYIEKRVAIDKIISSYEAGSTNGFSYKV